jgi:hypothetical protein
VSWSGKVKIKQDCDEYGVKKAISLTLIKLVE